jgi:hypothetical protein
MAPPARRRGEAVIRADGPAADIIGDVVAVAIAADIAAAPEAGDPLPEIAAAGRLRRRPIPSWASPMPALSEGSPLVRPSHIWLRRVSRNMPAPAISTVEKSA